MFDDSLNAPPHNVEAEMAVLGALMFDNDVYDEIGDWLRPEHFYDPLHARLYEACATRISQGQLADAVNLKSAFENDPGMAELEGGVVYLADLMRESPEPSSAVEYARLVYDLSVRRALIKFGAELSAHAKTSVDAEPAMVVLGQAQAELAAIESSATALTYGEPTSGIEGVIEAAERARLEGYQPGVMTGYRALDRLTGGLQAGDLVILAGRPSMGKTTVAFDIGGAVAQRGLKVGAISQEMTREQLWQRYIVSAATRAGYICDIGALRRGEWYSDDDREGSMLAAREFGVKVRPCLRVDDRPNLTVQQVAQSLRRMRADMGGLDLVLIDYLQLMRGDGRRRDGNRTQELSDITNALKAMAKTLACPVIALSQLSRQVEQRDNKRPLLSDLRESGSIEQDADAVMFVYREAYYLERNEPREGSEEHSQWLAEMAEIRSDVELIVAKNRQGRIGTARLTLHAESFRLEDDA